MTRFGNPWTYVLRDILYDATDMKSAIKILTETPRTCAIHLGIASTIKTLECLNILKIF